MEVIGNNVGHLFRHSKDNDLIMAHIMVLVYLVNKSEVWCIEMS